MNPSFFRVHFDIQRPGSIGRGVLHERRTVEARTPDEATAKVVEDFFPARIIVHKVKRLRSVLADRPVPAE